MAGALPISIRTAVFPGDLDAVLAIWREYVVSPSVSLDYQNNEAEFAQLPGKYAEPEGRLLLAEHDGCVVGCVAVRRVNGTICEMKRLYVRPTARGQKLGRRLIKQLIIAARDAGYVEMRLDVLAEFGRAQKLYREIGFVAADPVVFNPVPGTQFLGLRLR